MLLQFFFDWKWYIGNVQKKGSNTIPTHCFGSWCSIWIIIKATHLCNCVIHKHTFKFIWVGNHNNWYHMTVKISGPIFICWRKWIIFLIIICYIRYRCFFLKSVNKILANQLCLFVVEGIINEWMILFLKICNYEFSGFLRLNMWVRECRVTTISNLKTIIIIRNISTLHFILRLLERNFIN